MKIVKKHNVTILTSTNLFKKQLKDFVFINNEKKFLIKTK